MGPTERFWSVDLADARKGYSEEDGFYICLLCGHSSEIGVVYPVGERLFDARKYMEHHVASEHGSVFDHLTGLDQRITGLTEHQAGLLKLFYEGKNDQETQAALKIGSIATVRRHRYALREKERQARILLVLMDLIRARSRDEGGAGPQKAGATMLEMRYGMTESAYHDVIDRYFLHGPDGPLRTFSMREKNRIAVIGILAKRFEAGRIYTERQVNAILKKAYPQDPVALRRAMIDFGFMGRERNGSGYWIRGDSAAAVFEGAEPYAAQDDKAGKDGGDVEAGRNGRQGGAGEADKAGGTVGAGRAGKGEKGMEAKNRRKELLTQYKEKAPDAGLYRIVNRETGRYYLGSSTDLHGVEGRFAFAQKTGAAGSMPLIMAADLKQYGLEAFGLEILERLEIKPGATTAEIRQEMKQLEALWREENGSDNEYRSAKKAGEQREK